MCWIIPTNSLTKRDLKFLEKCKDDAVNKSIPIIDETDPKYFPYAEENLPIPIVIEESKKIRKIRNYVKESGIIEYIQNMSKKEEQVLKEQISVITQQRKRKKKLQ